MTVQYLTDEKGHQTAVVVPINEWKRLTSEVAMLHNKKIVFEDIKEAFQEVADSKAGKKKLEDVSTLFNG